MTTKIFFKVTWIFKDGRNSVASDFSVDIYQDVFDSIPNEDNEEREHILKQFSTAFFEAFPQFIIKNYKMTALDSYGRVINIDPHPFLCWNVKDLIICHKDTCTKVQGAIPLKIEQRRSTQEPLNALTGAKKNCRECRSSITGISFQCVQCEDYNMCSLCVTSGKHPQHAIIRAMDSKVNRDTVAKLLSSSVKFEELEAKVKEQDVKLKEKDAEIQSLVAARSQAVALLSSPCDGISTPQNKRRKTGVSQGPQAKNIKVEK